MNPNSKDLALQLASIPDTIVETDKPLAPYTYYGIGGPAAVWVAPRREPALRPVLEAIQAAGAPLFILGRGSNLLVSDRGWPGVTIYIGENLSGMSFSGLQAEARAGTLLMDLVRSATERGLGGMELMAGIPGSVGGALCMNAGAFGREIEALTLEVTGYRVDGSRFHAARGDLTFCYRRAPELERVVITSGRFQFHAESSAVLKDRIQEILNLRAQKQPIDYPSCGSVFKRPPGYYAGALIEQAGLKGERLGGAEVSRKHAGFIVNTSRATAADVYGLIRRIEQRVFERFGVRLEREVRLIGDFEA